MINPRPYRRDFPYSYIWGIYPVLELLTIKPYLVRQVFITSNTSSSPNIKKITDICSAANIEQSTNDQLISKLSGSDNSHVLAVFEKNYPSLNSNSNHVVLVNPSDMGNLGTIMRTMASFNFSDLAIIDPAVDIFDPKVLRASMGSLFHLNFSFFSSFSEYQIQYSRHYYPFMTTGGTELRHSKFIHPYSLIFGSEGPGLSPDYNQIGTPIKISQSNQVDSLNLSIAVALALYACT